MTRTAQIIAWMSQDEMHAWLKGAETKVEYQHRLVIWMAVTHPMPANQVADMLGISTQAVWKWIGEYNHSGPEGLARLGRGGRRRALFSLAMEKSLVERIRTLQAHKPSPSIRSLVSQVSKILGRKISVDYLYRLLRRWPAEM